MKKLSRKITSKKIIKKSSKSSSRLPAISLLVLLVGFVGYLLLTKLPKPESIGINEVSESTGTTTISLPPVIKGTLNQEVSTDITIDTGSSKVTAVQVELSYDPSSISTPILTQGDFLTDKLGTPKVENGKITFVYVVPLTSGSKSGTGKLATLKFKPQKENAQLTFTSNTMVAAIDQTSNVLKSASGSTIQLNSSSTPLPPPTQVAVPPAKPIATKKTTTNTPANPNPSARTFDESGNFDYSASRANVIDETLPATKEQSAFARFLAIIKNIFKGSTNDN